MIMEENNNNSIYNEVVNTLNAREIKAFFVPNKESARKKVLDLIPEGKSVGIGGSVTIKELDILNDLKKKKVKVIWHWLVSKKEENLPTRRLANQADIYLASTNSLTKDGRLVNIDGVGNRVTGMIYGPSRVILVVAKNKIADNLESALYRIRNVACAKNARRINRKLPCVVGKCNDCNAPGRMCKVVTIIERNPGDNQIEVILVGEDLGY